MVPDLDADSELDLKSSDDCIHPSRGFAVHYKLSYIVNILFDTVIFLLAAVRMGVLYRENNKSQMNSSIVSVLLRDGEFQISSNTFPAYAYSLIFWLQGSLLYA